MTCIYTPSPLSREIALKLNILIDAGHAVLCDFGLSRVRDDMASRTTVADVAVAGSRNWMAPERLTGRHLRFWDYIVELEWPTNRLIQILTNETPLAAFSVASYIEFIELVVEQDRKPEQPDEDEAQMADGLWQLAERCWQKNPRHGQIPISSVVISPAN